MYGSGRFSDFTVKLDQIPRWSDQEANVKGLSSEGAAEERFQDPLSTGPLLIGSSSQPSAPSAFPVNPRINSKLFLWRGAPWSLEVDAVVNPTNEALDESHHAAGLVEAAGTGLIEECATLGGCRTGEAKVTGAYNLPAKQVFHTVGPRYVPKYQTAAELALSHCYRACLELLIENGLHSIAMGCLYTEAKGYPREPAAHVAIRTVRRFLEKHDGTTAVVFCTTTALDTDIYKRLLPLYFPRDAEEEEAARFKLPHDTGDENGETVQDERRIRIAPTPGLPGAGGRRSRTTSEDYTALTFSQRSKRGLAPPPVENLVDPAFMAMVRDPDQRRKEQWERSTASQGGWGPLSWMGLGQLGAPSLTPGEEEALHSRYLARANALNLSDMADMKIMYRGGEDSEGRPVMVIIGAHFLLRSLDLERFVLFVVKEMAAITSRPYTVVYFHSSASLGTSPDLGWMKRVESVLGHRHRQNLHAIYIVHPSVPLKLAVFTLQVMAEPEVWKRVVYMDRLIELFRFVPREQIMIPDFIFQHDLEVNGEDAMGYIPRRSMSVGKYY